MSAQRSDDEAPVAGRSKSEVRLFPRAGWVFGATFSLALVSALALLTGFAWADAWSAEDKAVLASLSLDKLPPPPRDPSHAVQAVPAAAAFGRRLFADTRFSRNQSVSCATCHARDRRFQDRLAVGKGVGTGSRRAMPIAAAASSPWFFWDGRKDSLWSKALGPLEDAVEHGSNRTRIAKLPHSHYRAGYEALFGPMPDLSGLPQDAGPHGNTAERAAWLASHRPEPPAGRESRFCQSRQSHCRVREDAHPWRVAR
jgi:cytochrome c peroxidase